MIGNKTNNNANIINIIGDTIKHVTLCVLGKKWNA